jgi:hypothetical protein
MSDNLKINLSQNSRRNQMYNDILRIPQRDQVGPGYEFMDGSVLRVLKKLCQAFIGGISIIRDSSSKRGGEKDGRCLITCCLHEN